jgi:hypothetical protein
MTHFMEQGERLILMDLQVKYELPDARLPADDIKALVEAGIRTAMIFHVDWNRIEPVRGQRSLQYLVDRVELLHECGMKSLVMCHSYLPNWIPDEWKVRNANGQTLQMISPWNSEAMAYATGFYSEFGFTFMKPYSMAMNGWLTDGETLFPNEICIFDEAAKAAYHAAYGAEEPGTSVAHSLEFLKNTQISLFVFLQHLLSQYNVSQEIWTALHPALAGYPGNGCAFTADMLAGFKSVRPCGHINHLYCTWTQWDNYFPQMMGLKEAFGERVYGGAEYAEGVVAQTQKAISVGIDGLLIGPCHPFTGHTRIEPWMLENIKTAMGLWAAVPQGG